MEMYGALPLGQDWETVMHLSPESSGPLRKRAVITTALVRELAQGRMATKWQSQDSTAGLSPYQPTKAYRLPCDHLA